jgi:hypothetical protein
MAQDEFYCDECRMTFDSKDALEEHNRQVHSRYTCEVCGAILTSEREMEDHNRHLHPDIERTPR